MIFLSLLVSVYIYAEDLTLRTMVFSSGATVKVEVADSVLKRTKGLMNRTEMAEDRGMLFIFEQPQKLSFWNKNTFIALDVGYFDKNRVLKEVIPMQPQNMMEKDPRPKTYPSDCQCQFVLEVNQGWFKKNKVKVGDTYKLSQMNR